MTEDIFEKLNIEDERVEAINGQIKDLAKELGFTWQETLDYVIVIGLAYARRPPETAGEPGA